MHKFTRTHGGRSPSLSELGEVLGVTKEGAATLVRYCVARGFLEQHRVVVELHVTKAGQRWL